MSVYVLLIPVLLPIIGGAVFGFCKIRTRAPEGTRHHKDLMEEVETGAAVLALRAKVPILPVYIESKPKFLRVNHVCIGEPMDISDLSAQGFNTEVVEALCSRIRDTFFDLRKECQERK